MNNSEREVMSNLEWNKRYTMIAIYAFLVIIGSITFFLAVSNISIVMDMIAFILDPLKPVFTGMIIAYLLLPVLKYFEKKLAKHITKQGLLRACSILLTYLISMIVLIGFLFIIVPEVMNSLYSLGNRISEFIEFFDTMVLFLNEQMLDYGLSEETVADIITTVDGWVDMSLEYFTTLLPYFLNYTFVITGGLFRMVIGIIISIYLLASKDTLTAQFYKICYAFMDEKKIRNFLAVTNQANKMVGGFIIGKIIDSIIIGCLCFGSLSLMNMPNTILISFIVGVTNIIPFFGPFIGAIPCVIILVIESPVQALIFIVFIIILQQIDGNIIGPMILGDSTGLSPFWVLFSILFFGGVMGIPGMIIGVPVFGLIYWLLSNNLRKRLLAKGLPTKTDDYRNMGG